MVRITDATHHRLHRSPLRMPGLCMALAVPVFLPILVAVVTVQSVGLSPATVQSGSSSTGTVTLSGTTTTEVKVALFSSKPSLATVPASIIMGKTKTRTATFPIRTVSGQAGCATVSAQVVGTGPRPPAQLFVQPNDPSGPITLTLSGNTVVAGGQPLPGFVTVFQTGSQGAVVQLSSSNPQVTVPASVTLHETEGGPFQASLSVTAAVNAAPTCAIITATFQGSRSRALVKVAIISG
jgi:hypothetical protein